MKLQFAACFRMTYRTLLSTATKICIFTGYNPLSDWINKNSWLRKKMNMIQVDKTVQVFLYHYVYAELLQYILWGYGLTAHFGCMGPYSTLSYCTQAGRWIPSLNHLNNASVIFDNKALRLKNTLVLISFQNGKLVAFPYIRRPHFLPAPTPRHPYFSISGHSVHSQQQPSKQIGYNSSSLLCPNISSLMHPSLHCTKWKHEQPFTIILSY